MKSRRKGLNMTEKNNNAYSKYDRFCLSLADKTETAGDRVGNLVETITVWCADHSRFCWTLIIGWILSFFIGVIAPAFYDLSGGLSFWTIFLRVDISLMILTVVVSIFMLFYDRAELIRYREWCEKQRPNKIERE